MRDFKVMLRKPLMEAVRTSETSVYFYDTTRPYFAGSCHFQNHENLKTPKQNLNRKTSGYILYANLFGSLLISSHLILHYYKPVTVFTTFPFLE
jgi:hypothetical protein